ncbi:heterokaryon incompatibility protein-domain-containing protein [Hypoxylon sp. NC1633]|nr:heterokaryon incompatibility protein-domain-containing protein [Hypoxylon sp. NC1633]
MALCIPNTMDLNDFLMDIDSGKTNDKEIESFCQQCQEIDWPTALEGGMGRNGNGTKVIRIFEKKSRTELLNSICRVCRLVGHLVNPDIPEDAQLNVCLETSNDLAHSRPSQHPTPVKLAVRSPANDSTRIRGYKIDYTRFIIHFSSRDDEDVNIRILKPSQVNFDFFKEILLECLDEHKECQSQGPEVAELKVIDVDTGEVRQAPPSCKYAALSYVWGDNASRSTQKGFPPVVQDAITATKALGCQYLWVDQYCIDQDSSHKKLMIQKMGQVYANAWVTIIAASGSSAHDGLPGIGGSQRYQGRVDIGRNRLIEASSVGSDTIRLSKWATRGWTYQEGYLSKRRLIFTDKEVLFLCNERLLKETQWGDVVDPYKAMNPKSEFSSLGDDHDSRIISSFDWMRPPLVGTYLEDEEIGLLIEEYSKRNLSQDCDSLDAFLGILKLYRSNHFWGIPLELYNGGSVYCGLIWNHQSIAHRRDGLPSWSWSGWGGPVKFSAPRYQLHIQSPPLEGFGNRTIERILQTSVLRRDKTIDLKLVPGLHRKSSFSEVSSINSLLSELEESDESAESCVSDTLHDEDPKELSITSFIVPLRFRKVDTYPGVLLTLAVRPGVFLCTPVHFDREYNSESHKWGLVLPSSGKYSQSWDHYNIIVLHPIADGKYERAGIVTLLYDVSTGFIKSKYPTDSASPCIYLDALDRVIGRGDGSNVYKGPPNEHFFLNGSRWETVCLV